MIMFMEKSLESEGDLISWKDWLSLMNKEIEMVVSDNYGIIWALLKFFGFAFGWLQMWRIIKDLTNLAPL